MSFQVEIFKTNIFTFTDSEHIISILKLKFPESEFNIDLWDSDKILRVKSEKMLSAEIEKILVKQGFECYLIK